MSAPAPYFATEVPYYDWIAFHAANRPDQLAQVDLASGRRYTYQQMDDRVRRLAGFLKTLDVGQGDRVSVLANNATEVFEVQFACARLGAIFVPLNWRLTVHELDYILGDANPKVLVHDRAFVEAAQELQGRGKVCRLVDIAMGDPGSAYEQGLQAAAGERVDPVRMTHADILMIMYTSGTTGYPKGATITYGMAAWNAVHCTMAHELTQGSVNLVVLPLFHTGGLNCYGNPVFHLGGTNLVMRAFDAGQALGYLNDPALGITTMVAVPAIYQFMMQHDDFATTDLSRLAVCGVGGAPAANIILETWQKRGVALLQVYGMTETSPLVVAQCRGDLSADRIGAAGLPVLHVEVKIVDETGREITEPDRMGEIWVRGPQITPGYWNRPDANAASFEDGFLKTGDAARRDHDGVLYIIDRWKDMYISGGENVYPAEVENVIYQLDGITEAAVIGVPDEKWGEVGKAFIVPKEGANLTEERVIGHCNERLARFKVPRYVDFIEALPRNATGKVLKRDLRDLEQAG